MIIDTNISKGYGPGALSYEEERSTTFCVFAFASDGWIMAAHRAELAMWGDGTRLREAVTKILSDTLSQNPNISK